MEIYKSEFWVIEYESQIKTIVPRWFAASAELTSELYRKEMLKYTDLVEEYKPINALIDNTKLGYAIPPDDQEWTNEELFPRIIAAGVKRVVILLPQELITQLSLEQVMEEEHGLEFETKYMSNEKEAREWLNS